MEGRRPRPCRAAWRAPRSGPCTNGPGGQLGAGGDEERVGALVGGELGHDERAAAGLAAETLEPRPEDAAERDRFKKLITMDDMANNCAAELGIGTSHIIPGDPIGYVTDKGRIGHVHIACGRNYDLGGKSASVIHQDSDMTRATLIIDDVTIMEKGELKI